MNEIKITKKENSTHPKQEKQKGAILKTTLIIA